MSLFWFSWIKLGCDAKNDRCKITKKISGIDKYLFIEKGLRGRISYITKRYAKANNKYMNDDYDPKKSSKFMTYVDMINLYGWGLSDCLSHGGFKW